MTEEKRGIGGRDCFVVNTYKEGTFIPLTFAPNHESKMVVISYGDTSVQVPAYCLESLVEWLKSWEYI